MTELAAFVVGLIVGASLGVTVLAWCMAGAKEEPAPMRDNPGLPHHHRKNVVALAEVTKSSRGEAYWLREDGK